MIATTTEKQTKWQQGIEPERKRETDRKRRMKRERTGRRETYKEKKRSKRGA